MYRLPGSVGHAKIRIHILNRVHILCNGSIMHDILCATNCVIIQMSWKCNNRTMRIKSFIIIDMIKVLFQQTDSVIIYNYSIL